MNTLYVTIGLPGSGKSTWAHQQNMAVVSSDGVRSELHGSVEVQDNPAKVFQIVHSRVKEQLKHGDMIMDATNLNARKRAGFLSQIFGVRKVAVLFATSYEKVLHQNRKRDRQVPESAIQRMRESFQPPMKWEGWDDIRIVWNGAGYSFPWAKLEMDQENPNHSLPLNLHMAQTAARLAQRLEDRNLLFAARFHDIGKVFTKKFEDGKGQPTAHARYFGHQNVGAYEVMFVCKYVFLMPDENILDIAGLVAWHMQPYALEKAPNPEKAINKWIGKDGRKLEFWNRLVRLNAADRAAH